MDLTLSGDTETIADVCAALQNEVRLEILIRIAEEPRTLNELYIEDEVASHRSSVHRHLETLRDAGLLHKYLDQQTDDKRYRLAEGEVDISLSN